VTQVEREVPTSAGYVSVTERGRSGAPPVVLVHGYPDRASVWDEVAADLAHDHHVVAYDVRGAGGSPAPESTSGYALAHLLADLAAVLDATVGDRRAHLVGHDWGAIQGFAAAGSATLRPRLASFTAISAPGLDVVGAWVAQRLATRSARDLAALARQAGRSWYLAAFQIPVLPEAVLRSAPVERTLRRAGHPAPAATVAADAVAGLGLYRANRRPSDAGGPTLPPDLPARVLIGRDDPFLSPGLFGSLRAAGTDIRELHGGHWLPLTAPGRVATEVRELVAATR
jgi:pimeloyl-ACP methyl ester carboxylesterase